MAATIPIMPSVVNTSASVNEAFGDKNCLLEALDNKAKNLTGALFLGAPPPRKSNHSLLFHTFSSLFM